MKHGSLFSGIGGFDLASEWMGWENVFHCEWEDFPRKVLHHYWPNAISYGDIKQTDFTIHRGQIDILTGGFPCQPYSQAGKRLGKEDDRHLWPEMLRAIRGIQPTWIVGENVRGLVNWSGGLVFEEVQADLEAEGYEVQPFILPACAVNAPHRRDRVWFVAYSNLRRGCRKERSWEYNLRRSKGKEQDYNIEPTDKGLEQWDFTRPTPDTHKMGFQSKGENEPSIRITGNGKGWPTPDTNNNGRYSEEVNTTETGQQTFSWVGRLGEDASHTEKQRFQKRDAEPTQLGAYSAVERHSGLPLWHDFPTQSPICSGNDELPRELDGITFSKWRTESIKAYGNAVVPELVLQIFKTIEEYEIQHRH